MVESKNSGTTASSDKGLCGGDEHPCNHVQQCHIVNHRFLTLFRRKVCGKEQC